MRRLRVAAVLVTAVLLVGCTPDGPSPGASAVPSSPVPTSGGPTPQAESTADASVAPTPSVPSTCWDVARPDVTVDSTQTPEEFAEENRALVDAGAPAPCSLFASGAHREEADAWLDALIAQGWTDQGAVEDDVYASRSAIDASGRTVSYLVSRDPSATDAISQFQLY